MASAFIYFHTEDISFSLSNESSISQWIELSIIREKKELSEINYIFCSDRYLLALNQTHLNHDTYTDIITFNYVKGNVISGDIFISIDRVKENAEEAGVSFENELSRVMIHGILHLVGYNDKTKEETQEMRAKEDFYLTLQSQI